MTNDTRLTLNVRIARSSSGYFWRRVVVVIVVVVFVVCRLFVVYLSFVCLFVCLFVCFSVELFGLGVCHTRDIYGREGTAQGKKRHKRGYKPDSNPQYGGFLHYALSSELAKSPLILMKNI